MNKNIINSLWIIVPGAIALVRWIFIKFRKQFRKRLMEKFTEIATRINGSAKNSFAGSPSITGNYNGTPVKIKYIPVTQYNPSSLRIDFLKKPLFRLSLRKEDWSTKISKRIGLARKITLNISEFDEKFFIQTNDRLNCATYFADSRNREIVEKICDKGWILVFGRKEIVVTKNLSKAEKLFEEKGIKGMREFFFKQNITATSKQEEIDVEEVMDILEALAILSKSWI